MSFLYILFAHWLGDFLFQTRRIAHEKSKNLFWLTIHILIYSISLFIISSVIFQEMQLILKFVGLNALFHWITDFITSKLTSRYRSNERVFFLLLGFDQLIHHFTLYLTFLSSGLS